MILLIFLSIYKLLRVLKIQNNLLNVIFFCNLIYVILVWEILSWGLNPGLHICEAST